MPKNKEVDYEGLYVMGLDNGKGKIQFIHKVKNGLQVRNGINSNIMILKKDEPNSEKALKVVEGMTTYKDFVKYPLKDIVEQNKTVK